MPKATKEADFPDFPVPEDAPADAAFLPASRTPDAFPAPRPQRQRAARQETGDDWPERFAAWTQVELAQGRAFILAPVFLGLGSVLWFAGGRDMSPSVYLVAFAICLTLALRWRYGKRAYFLSAAAGALIAAGMGLAAFESLRASTVLLDAPVTLDLEGRIATREALASGGWRYTINVIATENPALRRPPARVVLSARDPGAGLLPGEGVAGRARLSPPSGPAMPGLTDFAFSAYFDGVGAIGYFYGAPHALALPPAGDFLSRLSAKIDRVRGFIGERIRSVVPGDAGAFATAMVTDERRAMSQETAEALRQSGLAHIIAISGLNMALSAGIFYVGLRALFSLHQGFAHAYPVKKIAAAGALVGVTAYYLLSGSAVSAERAWLMMSIMLIAVLVGRPSISMRNVALSALVILVLSPSDVMGASFQMSFAATVGLVAGYAWLSGRQPASRRPLYPVPAWLLKGWKFFAGIALTSIIGGVSTAIFSVAHFQQMALWGLPANLAAMPIVSFIVMPAGLIAMLLMPFGLDRWPLVVMGEGLDLVITVAKEVTSWGGGGGTGLMPPYVFPLVVLGFLWLTLLETRLRYAGAMLIAATLAAAAVLPTGGSPDIVIAESGDLVGLIGHGTIATNRERPPGFLFAQWQRALGDPVHLKPNTMQAVSTDRRPEDRYAELDDKTAADARKAMTRALTENEPGRFTCEGKRWCIALHGSTPQNMMRIAVVQDAAYVTPACDRADLVVTPVRLRRTACLPADRERPLSRESAFMAKGHDRQTMPADVRDKSPHAPKARLFTGVFLGRNGAIALRFDQENPGRLIVETAMAGSDRPWNRHRLYDWRSGTFTEPAQDIAPVKINDTDE